MNAPIISDVISVAMAMRLPSRLAVLQKSVAQTKLPLDGLAQLRLDKTLWHALVVPELVTCFVQQVHPSASGMPIDTKKFSEHPV